MFNSWRAGHILAAASLAGTLVTAASAGASAATGAGPGTTPASIDTQRGFLNGVAVVSARDAWAVGESDPSFQTLIDHWNGQAWKRVPSPNPAGSGNSGFLQGVAATSPSNAWAVGNHLNTSNGTFLTLIERWNGAAWKIQASPNVCACFNVLHAVAATSAGNAWAVGAAFTRGLGQTVIVHWNGRSWTRVPSPNPAGSTGDNELFAVTATSAGNAWAVGHAIKIQGGVPQVQTLILHWNGRSWTRVPSPNPAGSTDNQLFAVTATSGTSAWATGFSLSRTAEQTLIERWNGRAWTIVASPNPGGPTRDHELTAAAATSPSNAWTVGLLLNTSSGIAQTLTERWNGRGWISVASPNPGGSSVGNSLTGVAATSLANAWAVGDYGNSTAHHTLFEHWNGRAWAHVAD